MRVTIKDIGRIDVPTLPQYHIPYCEELGLDEFIERNFYVEKDVLFCSRMNVAALHEFLLRTLSRYDSVYANLMVFEFDERTHMTVSLKPYDDLTNIVRVYRTDSLNLLSTLIHCKRIKLDVRRDWYVVPRLTQFLAGGVLDEDVVRAIDKAQLMYAAGALENAYCAGAVEDIKRSPCFSMIKSLGWTEEPLIAHWLKGGSNDD